MYYQLKTKNDVWILGVSYRKQELGGSNKNIFWFRLNFNEEDILVFCKYLLVAVWCPGGPVLH